MKKPILILLIAALLVLTVAMTAIEALASKQEPQLEKMVFIHYKKDYAKPSGTTKQTACYKFLTPKVRWQNQALPVSYTINPNNSVQSNLSSSEVVSAVLNAAEEWDNYTSKELMNSYNIDYNAIPGDQDYKNVIGFGNYGDPDVIAVTTVWYNPATKAILEFDIMLDTDWVWGDAAAQCNSNETFTNSSCEVMDLQNILTHEFGHAIGLGDVYDSTCSEVTMYGYSLYGEVKKRTLEPPDITGLRTLYGT
ncbi:MAG: matrixin family metalloprotease [Archaeoglobales archaeon]|nr:matrixin family metalloprotease [Archaeoglobales archaeon]